MNKRNHSISVRLLKIIFYLIEPPPDVTDVQKKSQSRLLSALLLIIILLGSGSAIIQWLLVPGFLSTFISIEGAVIILFMAYLLVHRGQFITAAIIASITPSLACYASLLTNTNDPSAFVFMLISVLLGSILLNQRLTIGIASLNLLALLLLPILQPAWTYSMMGGIVSYHIIIPLLILLSMWHRDWLERDRREELRRRSERFSVLFNSTSDIQMVLSIGDDRNFYIEAVNQSYLNGIRRFKPDLTERDVIGRNRAEFQREVAHVSPQELNARDRLFWQAIDGRTPVRIEDVISSPQGNIYLDVLIVPIVEPDGTCKHVFWSARDVTSRKMAELALQESELKFRSIFDNSVDAIGVSRAGVHVMANPAYVNIFGYESADQLVGKSILDLIAPSHRVQILDFVRRRAAGEEIPSHYETCGLRRDGTEFDMEVHVSTYELGGERYTVPILRDITERKKSEDQIQYQANLLKNVSDAIIASDMDFKIVSWNQAAEALYGWQAGEVIGRPVSDVLQTEYLSEPADHVRQRFLEQGFWKGEVIQKHKDRFGLYILSSVSSIIDENGQPAGAVAVNHDITERRRMEEALRESEERYRIITELMSDYIFKLEIDPGGNVTIGYLSENYNEITGRTLDQIKTTETWSSILHPGDLGMVMNLLHTIIATGQPGDLECRSYVKEGRQRWVHVVARPVADQEGGAVTKIVGSVKDITERKQIQRELEENRHRLAFLLEKSPSVIYSAKASGDFEKTFISANVTNQLGYQPEDFINDPGFWMDHIHPDDAPRVFSELEKFFEHGVHTHEYRFRHKNGQYLWMRDELTLIRDDAGKPSEMIGSWIDITESKQADQALRESEERYRRLIETSPDSITLTNLEGIIVFCNQQAALLQGLGRAEEMIGRNAFEFVAPESTQLAIENARKTVEMGSVRNVEYISVKADGTRFPVELSASAILDTEGKPNTFIGVVRDITTRKQTEEKLRKLNRQDQEALRIAHMGHWEYDFETGQFLLNDQFYALLGITADAAGGYFMSAQEFAQKYVHPDDAPRVIEAIQQARETDDPDFQQQQEGRILRADGEARDTIVWFHIEKDSQGRTIKLYGVNQDITERKLAESNLRLSEERYRTLAQNLPDSALLLYNQDLRFIIADGPEIEGTGFSREMLEGKTLHEALPAEFAKLVEPNMRSALAGETFYAELPYEDRFYRYSYVPLRDSSGKVAMAMILATNITQLKKTEDALKDSQRRLSTALHATKVGVWEWDINTNKTYWSDENYEVMGLEPDSIESRYENWAKCVHPDDLPEAEAKVTEAVNSKSDLNIEFRVVWPDGSIHWINDIGSMLMDEAGQPLGMYGIQMDVTERKRMEEMLFEEKERAQITLQSIGDAVITTDVQARVKYLNPVAETMTGWKLEEAIDQPLDHVFRIIDEGSRQPAVNPVGRCLHEGRIVGLANHSVLIRRDGREFAVDDSAAPIRNRQGEIIGVVLVFHDVTEERRLSQQVAHDAMHDSLTGLVNRREFEKRLERALVNTKERAISHILCYLDLDQFKIVNDTAGHMAGDELLKQVSGLLAGLFRQRDTLARLGGDEFGLLLENCQLDRALVISNEIIAKIRDFPFVWATQSFQVGVSIGLVPITSETESVAQLLSQADIACYSAKDLGRGRIHIYQIEDSETTQRHSEILQASRMQDAIIHNQFRLYCQPIMKVKGQKMKMRQYELLLRMIDSKEQLVLPSAFIPSAERYGLMPAIDRWVIRQTLLTMSNYEMRGMQITINLSGNSLDDETLLGYVLAQLHEYSISPNQICFEITETAAIHHLSKAQHFIQAFRERGGRIALDDFGSGFSSFRYLKTLAVDYIKIDGGFVSDMLSNPSDLMMVQAITQIAHTLGIEVIAEHAADLKIINRLRKMGVDHAQGFGIGRPIPVEEAWDARKK